MKRKTWIWILVVMVLVGAGAYWGYRRWSSDSYLYALPSRPKALMAVDWPRLADDSGVGMEGLAALSSGGWTAPEGIDWQKKSYAFISGREFMGCLVAVADKEQLAGWFHGAAQKGRCQELKEQNGRYWTVWDHNWMVGFDDRALLVMGPGLQADMDVLRHEISTCFRQDKQESGMNSPLFASVGQSSEACTFVSKLDVLPDFYGKESALGLPEHASLGDVNVIAGLDFQENGLTVKAEIRSENPEINEYYEQLALLGGQIKGEYAGYVPEDALGWCCVNVNGEKLLEQLRKNPMVRTFLLGLNMGVDADLMIRSIQGDLAATVYPDFSVNKGVLLTARLKRKDFLNEVDYWKESAARTGALVFRDFGDNRFFMAASNMKAYFGVTGETLYVTPDEKLAAQVCGAKTPTLEEWKDEIGESRFFLWCNLRQLRKLSGWSGMPDLLGDLVLRSSDARHFTLDVRGEAGQNVWKELLK